MTYTANNSELLIELGKRPRVHLAHLPTPLHHLSNFSQEFDSQEIWIKRDDLTGLEGGGNKTRKLEFLVGDAMANGADMLVTAGAIQSNHTRQTAAAAAKCGLKCALLHFGWTQDAGPEYRTTGNILLSKIMGAQLFIDETQRPIEDQSPLVDFCEHLKSLGHRPYLIPGGASEHKLGSFGYMNCAAEIISQSKSQNIRFDYIVHCTGSSSTQAGLLAGFAALDEKMKIIGIADDDETLIKKKRVLELANQALQELEMQTCIEADDVNVLAFDKNPYGKADKQTLDAIHLLANTEGLIADPVYEAKAVRGLLSLSKEGYFKRNAKILLMHLGGSPAIHGYASQLGLPQLKPFPAA